MQTSNGAALLTRIARGSLVTIRTPEGGEFTGRASGGATLRTIDTSAAAALIVAPGRFYYATSDNVVRVRA